MPVRPMLAAALALVTLAPAALAQEGVFAKGPPPDELLIDGDDALEVHASRAWSSLRHDWVLLLRPGPEARSVDFLVQSPDDGAPVPLSSDDAAPFEAFFTRESPRTGEYRFFATVRGDLGAEVTLERLRYLEAPRAALPDAILGAATGAVVLLGVATASSAIRLRRSPWAALLDLFAENVQEAMKERTVGRSTRERRVPLLLAVLAGAALLLAAFIAAAEARRDGASAFLGALVVSGLAAGLALLLVFGVDALASRLAGGARTARFWWAGVAALAVSSLVFRAPFGTTLHAEDGKRPRVRSWGRFALGTHLLMLLAVVPFALVARFADPEFGAHGIGAVLLLVVPNFVPLRFLPGGRVWAWSRAACVASLLGGVALYVAWEAGFVPSLWVAGLGVLAAAGGVLLVVPTARRLAAVDAGDAPGPG